MPKKQTYLGRLADAADKLFHGNTVEQYGAICFRKGPDDVVEVLLITSRETGRWVIPKGWPIDKLAPHKVAEREAWEEAGIKGKAKKRPFGYYTYLKVLDSGEKVPSIVQVHLLEAEKAENRFPEEGQRMAQWLPPHEAATLVREPELKSLLGKVRNVAIERPKSKTKGSRTLRRHSV